MPQEIRITEKDEVARNDRNHLVVLQQKAQEAYDKTAVSLYGGALVVSLAFVSGFVPRGSMQASDLLMFAWFFWTLSLTAALFSHVTSEWGYDVRLETLTRGTRGRQKARFYDYLTLVLNVTAVVSVVAGVATLADFIWRNLLKK